MAWAWWTAQQAQHGGQRGEIDDLVERERERERERNLIK